MKLLYLIELFNEQKEFNLYFEFTGFIKKIKRDDIYHDIILENLYIKNVFIVDNMVNLVV